ncbi:MAG: zinc-ribbon domain-containing protein [Chloroflexota bacterium]
MARSRRRFCTRCGTRLATGNKFCTQCGNPVE